MHLPVLALWLLACSIEPPLFYDHSFEFLERQAVKTGVPLIVCIDCDPVLGPWFVCVRKSDDRWAKPWPIIVVNVVRDGKLVYRACVLPGEGAEQVLWNVLDVSRSSQAR